MSAKRNGPPKGWLEAKQKKALTTEIQKFRLMLPKIKRLSGREWHQIASDELTAAEDLLASGCIPEAQARMVKARSASLHA